MNYKPDTQALSTRAQWHSLPGPLEWADIVIIGNGIAGLTAAIEARRYGADQRIVIMTDQPHPTINTPALKQFSINKLKREQLLAYPPGTERSLNIHVIYAHVEKIHAQSKYLELSGNRAFGYGRLLIATGSRPASLPEEVPGQTFDGVIKLHRLKDYLDLQRRLPQVRDAVVIGGGMHANEVVMSLLHWGIRVHWLIRSTKFLPDVLDDTASEMVLNKVRRAGAIIHTETEVTAIVGRVAAVAGVITNTDKMIFCQLVVSCIGTSPAVGLAAQCTKPMPFNNGILVDGQLRTSVQDIYAAGDVAALLDPQTGEYKTRGQWYSAVTQGRIAGSMMVGRSEVVAEELFGVPWHATRLGKLSMLTVGDPLGTVNNKDDVVIHTDISGRGYRRIATVEDRLVGYLSMGITQPDGLSIKRFIDEGLSIRDVFKPLLKGKFDAHGYLTRSNKSITREMAKLPFSTVGRLQAFRWSEVKSSELQPSLPMLAMRSQGSEVDLAVQMQPVTEEVVSDQPEQPRLDVGTGLARCVVGGQFVKPGLIDTHYNKHKNLDPTAPSYEQPERNRDTDPLPVTLGEDRLKALTVNA